MSARQIIIALLAAREASATREEAPGARLARNMRIKFLLETNRYLGERVGVSTFGRLRGPCETQPR
jgi:hypothetical protein